MSSKNKITTPGYFMKRLRDNGFIALKLFNGFGEHDPRRWTVLVNPGTTSVFITCFHNKHFMNEIMFELNDGGLAIPRNFSIKTDSIEVIISYLISKGVTNTPQNSPYYVKRPKYSSEASQKEQ
jgi:hypothetical protein